MPPRKKPKNHLPAYRARPGYSQALVTLTDSETGKRRDYWLGEYDSPESHEVYSRILVEWQANGRRLPSGFGRRGAGAAQDDKLTIELILRDYWRWAEQYYTKKHLGAIRTVLRLLRVHFGNTPATDFGPKKLRLLREAMIQGNPSADPPRKPWARKFINLAVQRIRHVFKWAVSRELVPPAVYQGLCTMEPLKRGRTVARETEKIGPVPDDLLEGAKPFMSKPVRAMVELQLFAGARAGELLKLRACDLEIREKSEVWVYRPEQHKTAYLEHGRNIYFGPHAQQVLRPFLTGRATNAFLFSPAEAEEERLAARHATRKTPLSCGNRPGTNKSANPKRPAGDHYDVDSYRRAIQYACERAFPPPEELSRLPKEGRRDWQARLTAKQREELKAWRRAHRWHPHQLRHNAATLLRREFGLEAAQLALGHSSAEITDAVYAERDEMKVIEIMRKIG